MTPNLVTSLWQKGFAAALPHLMASHIGMWKSRGVPEQSRTAKHNYCRSIKVSVAKVVWLNSQPELFSKWKWSIHPIFHLNGILSLILRLWNIYDPLTVHSVRTEAQHSPDNRWALLSTLYPICSIMIQRERDWGQGGGMKRTEKEL